MAIIAVLTTLSIAALRVWQTQQAQSETNEAIRRTSFLITDVEQRRDMIPPMRLRDLARLFPDGPRPISSDNDTNEGIETVVQAGTGPGVASRVDLADRMLGNTDRDVLSRVFSALGHATLLEVLDAWGNPLVYIPHMEYGKVAKHPVTYVLESGEEVEVRPWRSAYGHFEHPHSFQLFSMGPDRTPNTDDDIRWGRSES